MTLLKTMGLVVGGLMSGLSFAHYPYVAPLSYQTFNNQTAVLSGFYDNPFSSEIAIKNFKFHYHAPSGQKMQIADEAWSKTKTVSSMSLDNREDGTYRIRGEKQGSTTQYALDGNQWKTLIKAQPKANQAAQSKVIFASQMKPNTAIKKVETLELIETFVSRKNISNQVIHHLHAGFDVQFLTHPNAIKVGELIQWKVLDDKKGIANLDVNILAQTSDFSREEKVYQQLKTNQQGELNFSLKEKGQYLLTINYQQPFSHPSDQLKHYKYTLAFNVID